MRARDQVCSKSVFAKILQELKIIFWSEFFFLKNLIKLLETTYRKLRFIAATVNF
jgi:hypothetical protein